MSKSDLPIMTDESGVACSWCPDDAYTDEQEQGQRSHGICEGHATVLRMRRQIGRMPSALDKQVTQQRQNSLVQW